MGRSGRELGRIWATTTQQWVRCAVVIADCYTSAMHPRPDLAIPAKTIKGPYCWWW